MPQLLRILIESLGDLVAAFECRKRNVIDCGVLRLIHPRLTRPKHLI
jgi:hypothetical protein